MKGPPIGWPFLCPRDLDGQCLFVMSQMGMGKANRAQHVGDVAFQIHAFESSALECQCGTWRLHGQLDLWPQTVKSEVRSTEELFQGLLAQMSEG